MSSKVDYLRDLAANYRRDDSEPTLYTPEYCQGCKPPGSEYCEGCKEGIEYYYDDDSDDDE
ncbi:MAG: hypothetical protein ABIL09_19675 [Gemmatimonadota bacterium]